VPAGARDFSLHRNVQTGSGAHPVRPSSYTGAKLLGREVDHSLPSSAFIALTWRTLLVVSLNGNYRVILSVRKIPYQNFRIFHMSCIYLWFIERHVCCVWLCRVIREERSVFLEVIVLVIVRIKEVRMNLCLIVNGHRDRAANVTPLDFCLWSWMICWLAFWILLPAYRNVINSNNTQSSHTCCKVLWACFEHLLWTAINLSFLCNKFVI